MNIALLFDEKFPASIAGKCIPLLKGKGSYTLGRNDETHKYDIDIQHRNLSRSQATITFHYNAAVMGWQVSDAGFNAQGTLVPYKNRCQVNGEFIPRNLSEIPDPVTIDPHEKKRILIGGNTDMKILVVAECESTLDQEHNPFEGNLWGTEVWRKISLDQEPVEDQEDRTIGVNLNSLEIPYFIDFVVISSATGKGLSDPDTRVQTSLSIVSAIGFILCLLGLYWIAALLGIAQSAEPRQPDMENVEPRG